MEQIKKIKFDDCREVLKSGNVWNCQKKPMIVQCKEMFEDFEIETLESGNGIFKGKKGDYIMIGVDGEMYVCDKEIFERTYEVKNEWDIKLYATNMEDNHFGIGYWKDSPFNDEAIEKLRIKKLSKNK